MPRTKRCNFLVLACKDDCLSLRIIGSSNNGKEVTVPKEHPEYTKQIQTCLCSDLEQGTILEAELVTAPETQDDWRVGNIVDHRRP